MSKSLNRLASIAVLAGATSVGCQKPAETTNEVSQEDTSQVQQNILQELKKLNKQKPEPAGNESAEPSIETNIRPATKAEYEKFAARMRLICEQEQNDHHCRGGMSRGFFLARAKDGKSYNIYTFDRDHIATVGDLNITTNKNANDANVVTFDKEKFKVIMPKHNGQINAGSPSEPHELALNFFEELTAPESNGKNNEVVNIVLPTEVSGQYEVRNDAFYVKGHLLESNIATEQVKTAAKAQPGTKKSFVPKNKTSNKWQQQMEQDMDNVKATVARHDEEITELKETTEDNRALIREVLYNTDKVSEITIKSHQQQEASKFRRTK
ncbi:hypothetical protein GF340_03560 [Candidatus Peregrinibacteria bacterium]|nr:hypothetical protein [Candidatus Peregrinibacteria bacterium]